MFHLFTVSRGHRSAKLAVLQIAVPVAIFASLAATKPTAAFPQRTELTKTTAGKKAHSGLTAQEKQRQALAKQKNVHLKGWPLSDYDIEVSLKKATLCIVQVGTNFSDAERAIVGVRITKHGSYNADGKYWPFMATISYASVFGVNRDVDAEFHLSKNDYGSYKIKLVNSNVYYVK